MLSYSLICELSSVAICLLQAKIEKGSDEISHSLTSRERLTQLSLTQSAIIVSVVDASSKSEFVLSVRSFRREWSNLAGNSWMDYPVLLYSIVLSYLICVALDQALCIFGNVLWLHFWWLAQFNTDQCHSRRWRYCVNCQQLEWEIQDPGPSVISWCSSVTLDNLI